MNSKEIYVDFMQPCKKCGNTIYKAVYKAPHVGLFCSHCDTYLKWLSKKEKQKFGIITPNDSNSTDGIAYKTITVDEFDDGEVPFE